MNDNDDLDVDIDDDNNELINFDAEEKKLKKELSSKRDVRSKIEDKLELIELKKLMSDPYYDEVFD